MLKKQNSRQCTKKPVCFSSKKGKKECFDNLDLRNVTDNKKFWKTVRPLFTDKGIMIKKLLWKMMKSYQKTKKYLNI